MSRPAKSAAPVATSRAPRLSTSKPVKYRDEAEEEDDEIEMEGEDEGADHDNEGEGEDMNAELRRVLDEWQRSIAKPDKDKFAKAEQQMKELFDKGKRETDAAIRKQAEKNAALVHAANLNRANSHVKHPIDQYITDFADLQENAQRVADAIDEIVQKDLDGDDLQGLASAKQAFDARPRAAKRTYKKLSKTIFALCEESYALAEEQQQTGEMMYRHLKAVARA